MEFVGTEVGIKIRSAIKAKLTELGKTVDDELIDYIMVMVANKKEEGQMATDLQPFLEGDTVLFTSWLHKVLQKLEQVTVVVTDEEYKIASSAFGKVNTGKKRKGSETAVHMHGKKKSSSRDEGKEKKKKSKHDRSAHKHKGSSKNHAALAIVSDKHAKTNTSLDSKLPLTRAVSFKPIVSVTEPSSKPLSANANSDVCNLTSVAKTLPAVRATSSIETATPLLADNSKENTTVESTDIESKPQVKTTEVSPKVTPTQRPVMMVSDDDDDDDDDFINIKADVIEEDELMGDARNPTGEKKPAQNAPSQVLASQTEVEAKSDKSQVTSIERKTTAETSTTLQKSIPASSVTSSVTVPSNITLATEVSRETTSPTPRVSVMSRIGAVLKRKASQLTDEEEEEEEKQNGTVASVIQVKPRPKIPAAKQAPKNLLLRAVAEAQRSIATAKKTDLHEERKAPLFTRKYRNRQNFHETIAVTLPNVPDPEESTEVVETSDDKEDFLEPDEAYEPAIVTKESAVPEYSPSPISKPSDRTSSEERIRCSTPEFLVTLDGYGNYSKEISEPVAKSTPLTTENVEDEEEDEAPDVGHWKTKTTENLPAPEEVKPRRQKIVFNSEPSSDTQAANSSESLTGKSKMPLKSLDRCRFWPACRQGDSCTFHHPTQICTAFPNCTFGDRCLYIHPNCKFDASCTRKDCPFTHASPRNLLAFPLTQAPAPVARPAARGVLTCRFFPNCSNTNCRFYHPKPCRYGRQCSKPDCVFSHTEFPPKEKMKWVSSTAVQ